jgi:hypothetical protein
MAAGPPPPDLATWAYNLGFSLDALALNRRGIVSPEQMRGWFSLIIVDALLPLFYLVCTALIAYLAKPWWRWLLAGCLLGLSTFSFTKVVHRIQDRLHPEAVAVEGKVTVYAGHRNTSILSIGSKSFTVLANTRGHKVAELFDRERTYRVYYLRHSGAPLSIEPVATGTKAE